MRDQKRELEACEKVAQELAVEFLKLASRIYTEGIYREDRLCRLARSVLRLPADGRMDQEFLGAR